MKTDKPVIGVYGGTFDPVHIAHLRLVIEAKEQLNLSKIVWVPSGNPCHRHAPIASVTDRLSMLEMALKDDRAFSIDTTDLYSKEPTYTVNTLKRIRQGYDKETPFVFLLGSDALLLLPTWYDWTSLFDLAHIAVATRLDHLLEWMPDELKTHMDQRLGKKEDIFETAAGRIVLLPMIECDISASSIREKAKKQLNLSYLVPLSVQNYITQHAIYSEDK